MASPLQNSSNDLAAAAETVGPSVVAVHGQHRIPSSGIQWRKDVIVTVNHGIRANEGKVPLASLADASGLKLANLVLALGRSWRGNLVASAGIVGGLSGAWRT